MAFTEPTPADLKARFPAFADVADATVQVYLDDTAAAVDQSWPETLYTQAKAAKAAHEMALLNLGVRSEAEGWAAAGLTRVESGNFKAQFSDDAVRRASAGGLTATPYGMIYKRLLRAAKGGPRMVNGGPAAGGWGPTAQQNDGGVLPWAY